MLDTLQAGADGYILKGAPPDEIAKAVRAVCAGETVIAPTVTPALVREIRRSRNRRLRLASGASVQLTERKWAILQLLDEGRSTSNVAAALFVAPVTIRTPHRGGRAQARGCAIATRRSRCSNVSARREASLTLQTSPRRRG